jgi:hypothetical protein
MSTLPSVDCLYCSKYFKALVHIVACTERLWTGCGWAIWHTEQFSAAWTCSSLQHLLSPVSLVFRQSPLPPFSRSWTLRHPLCRLVGWRTAHFKLFLFSTELYHQDCDQIAVGTPCVPTACDKDCTEIAITKASFTVLHTAVARTE